jgi:hypothetical protein
VDTRQKSSIPKGPTLQKGKANGAPDLRAVFPTTQDAASQTVNLSFLLKCPNLSVPFSSAFIACISARRPATRQGEAACLKCGFVAFLEHENLLHCSLADLSTTLANHFIAWLDRVDSHTGTAVWSTATRSLYYGAFKSIISWLQQQETWRDSLPPHLALPSFRWPGLQHLHRPTAVLSEEHLLEIYRACIGEITATKKRITDLPELLQSAEGRVPQCPTTYRDYPDLAVCLAALITYFPDTIPNDKYLSRHHSYLLTALRQHGGILAVRRYLYPDVRGMVPFVLLLAIHTCYNPDVIRTSSIDDYSIEQRFGQEVFVARAYKWRSRCPQNVITPADAAVANPAALFALLLSWSERARRVAQADIKRRLFLFVPTSGHFNVMSYNNHPNGTTDVWRASLRMFCTDHKISSFYLRQIRHTMIDIGTALHWGDIRAAQALGGQRSPQTLFEHYTSDAQRQRNSERTAEVMSLRRRWRETGGLIDPRDQANGLDEGAATPGWRCFDPYDSPFATKGKLCDAYGMCPICPLAHLDLTSVYTCAQLHNLLNSIRKARERMTPQAFLSRFGPVETKLKFWLLRFPKQIHKEAKQFGHLPPLPIPE